MADVSGDGSFRDPMAIQAINFPIQAPDLMAIIEAKVGSRKSFLAVFAAKADGGVGKALEPIDRVLAKEGWSGLKVIRASGPGTIGGLKIPFPLQLPNNGGFVSHGDDQGQDLGPAF